MSTTIEIKYCDALIPQTEYVTHVGSATRKYTKAQAILMIENGVILYTVDSTHPRRSVALVEVFTRNGGKFIKSAADATKGNNLLHLPRRPSWLPLAA